MTRVNPFAGLFNVIYVGFYPAPPPAAKPAEPLPEPHLPSPDQPTLRVESITNSRISITRTVSNDSPLISSILVDHFPRVELTQADHVRMEVDAIVTLLHDRLDNNFLVEDFREALIKSVGRKRGKNRTTLELFEKLCHRNLLHSLSGLKITRENLHSLAGQSNSLDKLIQLSNLPHGVEDITLADKFVSGLANKDDLGMRIRVAEFLQLSRLKEVEFKSLGDSRSFIEDLCKLNEIKAEGVDRFFKIAEEQLYIKSDGLCGHFFHAKAALALSRDGFEELRLCTPIRKNQKIVSDYDVICKKGKVSYVFEVKTNARALLQSSVVQMEDVFRACNMGDDIRVPGVILGGLGDMNKSGPYSPSISDLKPFLENLDLLGRRNNYDLSGFRIYSMDGEVISDVTQDVLNQTFLDLNNYSGTSAERRRRVSA